MSWEVVLVQAASAAAEYYQQQQADQAEKIWKNRVVSSLDLITMKINEVLDAIEALKGWIHKELRKTVLDIHKEDVDSNRIAIDLIGYGVVGQPSEDQKDRLIAADSPMFAAMLKLTNWQTYGFEVYIAIMPALLAHLRFLKLMSAPSAEVSAFAEIGIKYIDNALDVANPASWGSALKHSQETGQNQIDAWDSRANRWWNITGDSEFGNVHGTIVEGKHGSPEWGNHGTPGLHSDGPFPEFSGQNFPLGIAQQYFINQFGNWRDAYLFYRSRVYDLEKHVSVLKATRKALEDSKAYAASLAA